MQTLQSNMLQSLRGVRDFLDAHADKLASVVNTGARQRLQQAITELEEDANLQDGSLRASKGATKQVAALRILLVRDHMAPIARIANADLPHTAQLEALKLPKGKPTPDKLAAAAYGMGSTAQPYAATFVTAGLPQDFIAQLEAAADALIAEVQGRMGSRTMRHVATTGLKSRITAGRNVVKILNSFVQTALKDDPALLSGWNMVRHVRRVGVTTPSVPIPTPGPTATPAPSPTPSPSPTAASAGPTAVASSLLQ